MPRAPVASGVRYRSRPLCGPAAPPSSSLAQDQFLIR